MRDRLSNLPDAVAHHIFSFLDQKDITRVGCVSKRCSEFHLSTPSLDFDFEKFPNMDNPHCGRRLELMNSLDRLLARRRGNKIQRFHVRWDAHSGDVTDCTCDEIFRTMTWVYDAVRSKVEELDLDILVDKETPLPFSDFMVCGSLKSLKVHMKCILKAPPINSSSNLECLSLNGVRIVDEEFFIWLSCSCKCIKDFRLENVFGIDNITLESSSLESFVYVFPSHSPVNYLSITAEKLERLHINWGNNFPMRQSWLNIFAPNLKCFTWFGDMFVHQHLGKFLCLEQAELSVWTERGFNIIYEVLCKIRGVQVLILHKKITEGLLKEGSMPSEFGTHIRHLHMHVEHLFDDLVPGMVSIFRGMPNLDTLYLKSDGFSFEHVVKSSSFDKGYWKVQNLAFVNKVRQVTIEICSRGSNSLELARFILERGHNLEKMVIVHSREQSKFLSKIEQSSIASNASIVYRQVPERGIPKGSRRCRIPGNLRLHLLNNS